MDYREVLKSKIEISVFLSTLSSASTKTLIEFSAGTGNNVRMLCHSSMLRFVFKFFRISVDGENIENHAKTIMWEENTLSVF